MIHSVISKHELFKKKHYFISKNINTIKYYKSLYKNKLPSIISTFINTINTSNYILKNLYSTEQNKFIGISKEEIEMQILFTNKNRWLKGKFYVKLIFEYFNNELFPVHLIEIQ